MKKKVHFGPEKKPSRCDAYTEIAECVATSLMFAISLLMVWGGQPDVNKYLHLLFSSILVLIIILSILKPLPVVRKYKLSVHVLVAQTILQAASIGLAMSQCQMESFIPVLAINLLTCSF